ncbi:MAG TPA: hypothetical protein DDZ60_03830 [Planktothrix sp. UBA10369]|jgi:hypothetical protein|nr:hypothetical protein [Planktothrix sp. UBA10369]
MTGNTKSIESDVFESIHWTSIQLPGLRSMPKGILDGQIKVVQKVLFLNESIRNNKRHPEVVVYDNDFIKYLLFTTISSIITDCLIRSSIKMTVIFLSPNFKESMQF